MGLTKNIMTRYPVTSGLIARTTSQTGHKESLEALQRRTLHTTANIIDAPNNALLLESNDFILFENGRFIEVE